MKEIFQQKIEGDHRWQEMSLLIAAEPEGEQKRGQPERLTSFTTQRKAFTIYAVATIITVIRVIAVIILAASP